MEPRIVKRDRIILVDFSSFGDPFAESRGWTEENEISRLWGRFLAYLADPGRRIAPGAEDAPVYEIHVESDETNATGHREVFVGVEVATLHDVPVQLLVKVLPATTYVVFTLRGEQISGDWSQMIGEWMLGSGHVAAHPCGVQLYSRRFKGLDDLAASELEVYVPIQLVDDAPPAGS